MFLVQRRACARTHTHTHTHTQVSTSLPEIVPKETSQHNPWQEITLTHIENKNKMSMKGLGEAAHTGCMLPKELPLVRACLSETKGQLTYPGSNPALQPHASPTLTSL